MAANTASVTPRTDAMPASRYFRAQAWRLYGTRVIIRPTPRTYRNGSQPEKVTSMTCGASVIGNSRTMANAAV